MKGALAKGVFAFPLACASACALGTLIAGGCGPIEYLNQVGSRAASAVAAAKLAQADRYAPYEYTAAEQYLHKAREEAGYAEYEDSIEYGRKAEELARRARAIALTRLAEPAPATTTTTTTAPVRAKRRSAPPLDEEPPAADSPTPSPANQ